MKMKLLSSSLGALLSEILPYIFTTRRAYCRKWFLYLREYWNLEPGTGSLLKSLDVYPDKVNCGFALIFWYLMPQTRFLRGSSIFRLDGNVERIFNPFVLIDRNLFLYKLLLLTREKHHSLSFGFVYYNYNCLSNNCLCHISSLENTTHREPYLSDISG